MMAGDLISRELIGKRDGQSDEKDAAKITKWQQSGDMQKRSGIRTLSGRGDRRHPGRCRSSRVLQGAAESENVEAQLRYGQMIEHGRGVTRDNDDAVKMYHVGAANNHEGTGGRLAGLQGHEL
jgi:TPR repeat protein